MRVFVTGGTGLVGRHTIAALRAAGHEVTALARTEVAAAALRKLGAQPVAGDLAATAVLERGVAESDAVVHAAAIVLARLGWDGFEAVNVRPTEKLARCAARAGVRFVHLSSVAVYGRRAAYDGGVGSVSEEFGLERPLFPGDHYARSKRAAELAVWRVAVETGLSVVALRPCVIYGEGDRHFVTRVVRVIARGIAPLIGRGDNPLSVVYAGNVAAAVLAALARPHVTGPFNVANDGVITQRAFVEQCAAGLGVRVRLLAVPMGVAWPAAVAADAVLRALRPRAPMTTLKTAVQFLARPNPFTSAKAEHALGWRPVVAPAAAVERTARWFAGQRGAA